MFRILAQLPDQKKALEAIGEKIAEGVSEGVKIGLQNSSENAPTNWILMFAAVMLAILGAITMVLIVTRFIGVLREINDGQDTRDREHRLHVQTIQKEFNERTDLARKECHDHSKDIVGMGKEAVASISTFSGRLEATAAHIDKSSESIERSVHGIRNVLQEHHTALTLALTRQGVAPLQPQPIPFDESGT